MKFDYINNHSPHTTRGPIYPAHICMAGPTAATSSAERQAIQVSQEAWDRAKDEVNRSVVMPEDASREDLMAYHYLLSKKNTEITRKFQEMEAERANLDRRKRVADLSSQRRAELSVVHGANSTGRTPQRHGSRLNRVSDATRSEMTRNLESSFMTLDERGNVIPKTPDRKSTRLNSSHSGESRMPSSA